VRDGILACASGILLVLSFPRFDLGFLAWVALVPLLVALDGKSPGAALGLSYGTGVVFFVLLFSWISTVPTWNVVDGFLTKLVYLPQYVGLWGLGLVWIRRRTGLPAWLVAPPLWVTSEYVRCHVSFLSLPWMFLGHSQHLYPPLIQISAVTGVYGLSFLIVLVNVAIAQAMLYFWRRSSVPPASLRFPTGEAATAGLLLLSTLAYGLFTLTTGRAGTSVKVALVQGNIPQERKWDRSFRQETVARYARLTRQAVEQAPALIVWPETAVPGDVEHDPDLRRVMARIAVDAKSHLLVGSAEYAKFTDRKLRERLYNSMYLLSPEGKIAGQYRKIRLVPFGEYTPLRDLITWPEAIAATSGAFTAGDRYTRFTVGDVSFGAVICWEIIYPDLFREFVKRGAEFMILGTNEAWFGDTAAPYQLLAMTVFRAVENRVAIARSANTGVTALIDPFGRITHRLRGPDGRDLFVEGILLGDMAVAAGRTLYTAYGDVFAYLAIGATLCFGSWAMRGPVAHGLLAEQGT